MSDPREVAVRRRYRRLLRLCPERFRREYAAAMEQAFVDLSREPRHQGPWGRMRLWRLSLWDLAVTAIAERSNAMGTAIMRATGLLSLRHLMIVNAVLFVLLGLSIIGPPGPTGWLPALGLQFADTGTVAEVFAPYALARFLAVVLISFGALLGSAASAAASRAGTTISGGLFVAYSLGAGLLAIQQTQIWTNATGGITFTVTALLSLGYGAAYVARLHAERPPRNRRSARQPKAVP